MTVYLLGPADRVGSLIAEVYTMSWLEPFIAKELGSATSISSSSQILRISLSYRKEIPYCATASYPDFQTSVTSQALVACSLQERKAETALPPTIR